MALVLFQFSVYHYLRCHFTLICFWWRSTIWSNCECALASSIVSITEIKRPWTWAKNISSTKHANWTSLTASCIILCPFSSKKMDPMTATTWKQTVMQTGTPLVSWCLCRPWSMIISKGFPRRDEYDLLLSKATINLLKNQGAEASPN